MKNINVYIFDNDLGKYDEYNPRYVLSNNEVKQILTAISKKDPYTYNINLFKSDYIKLLENISSIKINSDKVSLNFPFFNNRDIHKIKKIVNKVIKENQSIIKEKIKALTNKLKVLYPSIDSKISAYHLLCGKMFDGLFFDYLSEKGILKPEYKKKENRDYLLIGYENSYFCNKFNSNLLCSFNNARYERESLSSFGNAYGDRLDYFRYYKLRSNSKIYGKFKKLDCLLKDKEEKEITKESLKATNNLNINNEYTKALKYTRYVNKDNTLNVPIFYDSENKIKEFSDYVYESIGEFIINCLKEIIRETFKLDLCCLKYYANKDEITNELWHIFFGLLNAFLVRNNLVAKPKKYSKEGKYLKCIYK